MLDHHAKKVTVITIQRGVTTLSPKMSASACFPNHIQKNVITLIYTQ